MRRLSIVRIQDDICSTYPSIQSCDSSDTSLIRTNPHQSDRSNIEDLERRLAEKAIVNARIERSHCKNNNPRVIQGMTPVCYLE